MRIALITPVPLDSPHGNGVTARRWAAMLRELGHSVTVAQEYDGHAYDALIALHARKSAPAIRAFHEVLPGAPTVVALTGTDLYPDLASAGVDEGLLRRASRLVLLQQRGFEQLPPELRDRARVIIQSVPAITPRAPRQDCFEVTFLAHVREVKDPLLPARAVRLLPGTSRVQVTHIGEERDPSLAERASAESAANPRYTWLGPRPRDEALGILARSRALVLASHHEGGANAVSEALAVGLPVLATRIPGTVGLLGKHYPGYFPTGDADALAHLLHAVERDTDGLLGKLHEHCAALAPLIDPAGERQAWAQLVAELAA